MTLNRDSDLEGEICKSEKAIWFSRRLLFIEGAVSRNSAKLGNYKMPVELRET